jgi:hypothetical protein
MPPQRSSSADTARSPRTLGGQVADDQFGSGGAALEGFGPDLGRWRTCGARRLPFGMSKCSPSPTPKTAPRWLRSWRSI